MKINTKLIRSEEVSSGTKAFVFERPDGFEFKAGQTIDVTVLDPAETDAEGNVRTFSIASAPEDSELLIATRMRDTAFKRTLGGLAPGREVQIEGPMGSFTLHNDVSKPAVLLAGGIGITPFRSMVRHAAAAKLPHQIYLFYSNRRPEDTPFLAEFPAEKAQNPNFHLISTMTQLDPSEAWVGERGYITGDMVKKYVSDLAKPIYYLAGPPAMVAAMRKTLNEAGVDDDNIRSDEFAGY